jgi:hypothetical protein
MDIKYLQIVKEIILDKGQTPSEIIMINGMRYIRETEEEAKQRIDYSAGGRFAHLKGSLEH